MRLDLTNTSQSVETSIYFSSNIRLLTCKVIVIGADAIVHSLLKEKIELLSEFSLTSEFVASLYREIPGQYALVLFEKDRTTVVSDPYGIIKLYYFNSENRVILTDSLKELETQKLSLDAQALKYYFITGYTPSKHTFFKQVQKIEPFTINSFDKNGMLETHIYGQFGTQSISGNNFLEKFQLAISNVLDFAKKHYRSSEIALSGGIDSAFLLMLMNTQGMVNDSKLSAFSIKGLDQKKKIDNDYDLFYADRLAEIFSKTLSVADYDLHGENVSEDFNLLIESLGCEYSPAMGYVGFSKTVDSQAALINGQNADSVMSFGGMGWPRFNGMKLTGLNGFFTRFFQFYGAEHKGSILGLIAKLLRSIYYRINFPETKNLFTRQNYFKGLGLNPENRYYFASDPAYKNIENPDDLADWFESEYINPLEKTYKGLTDHALSVILYNKTYMQGSANRGTVLSALLFNKSIFLPYTSLEVLELMTNLKPDWRYVFYGKYPNVELGKKKLDLPKFVINRQDPNDSDSAVLMNKALTKNKRFNDLVSEVLKSANFERYKGVLTKDFISEVQGQVHSIEPNQLSTLMRFVWVESILQKHSLD